MLKVDTATIVEQQSVASKSKVSKLPNAQPVFVLCQQQNDHVSRFTRVRLHANYCSARSKLKRIA